MTRVPLVVALAGLVLLAACASDDPRTPPDDVGAARQIASELQPAVSRVVEANTQFAFDLHRRLVAERSGNLFYSPFSISTALAMTWAGARGGTADEMAAVLHFEAPADDIHAGFQALLASLNVGAGFGGYELSSVNRLWGQQGFEFLAPFLALTQDRYGAGLAALDFQTQSETARRTINDWVAGQTHDRIQDLMPEGSVTPDTRLVLTNAVYYKGTWQYTFDPRLTSDASFRVDASRTVTVPMMHQKGEWTTGGDGKAQFLLLPYSGRDLDMMVLLPGLEEGLGGLESRLTPQLLREWLADSGEAEVDVYLPRFTMTSDFSLRPVLSQLGMGTAFSDLADFTGICAAGGLTITDAVHKAFVKVNEEGTEAAAATGITVGVTSMPASFTVNRPFLFLIRDNVTGSILFVGRVVDPTT